MSPTRPTFEIKGNCHAYLTLFRFHADRTAGGERDHRCPDRAIAAGRPDGPRGGAAHPVHQQLEADWPGPGQLPRCSGRLAVRLGAPHLPAPGSEALALGVRPDIYALDVLALHRTG